MSNSEYKEYANKIFKDISRKIMLHRFNQLKSGEDISKDSKGRYPRLTGQIVIDILKGYNQLLFVNDERDIAALEKINESEDTEIQGYMFTRNCSNHYLVSLKEKYNGNINELNLCAHYGMLINFEKELMNNFNIDSNLIIKNKSQLLYDHLVFLLNKINPLGGEEPFGLNECWKEYWSLTIERMFSRKMGKKQFNYNSYVRKPTILGRSKSELQNQEVISEDLISKIDKWSEKYQQIYGSQSSIDWNVLPETIIHYDWDTRFLWLSTHLMICVEWAEIINKLKTVPLISIYGELVSGTLSILETIEIDQYQAIKFIPNFFIRLYDYLVMGLGAKFGYCDEDLDKQTLSGWYRITASDFLDANPL